MKYYVNNNALFSSVVSLKGPLFSEITQAEYNERMNNARGNRKPVVNMKTIVESEVEIW